MATGDGVDEALLRVIAQRLGGLRLIDTVDVFPAEKPSAIVAGFDERYFPPRYRRTILEVRVFTNGDFSITYREAFDGGPWQCRWDRHENPHRTRDHVHPPPEASTAAAVDRDFPSDVMAVLTIVLRDIDDRLGQIWDST